MQLATKENRKIRKEGFEVFTLTEKVLQQLQFTPEWTNGSLNYTIQTIQPSMNQLSGVKRSAALDSFFLTSPDTSKRGLVS